MGSALLGWRMSYTRSHLDPVPTARHEGAAGNHASDVDASLRLTPISASVTLSTAERWCALMDIDRVDEEEEEEVEVEAAMPCCCALCAGPTPRALTSHTSVPGLLRCLSSPTATCCG